MENNYKEEIEALKNGTEMLKVAQFSNGEAVYKVK